MRLVLPFLLLFGLIGCSSSKKTTAQSTQADTTTAAVPQGPRAQALETFQEISQQLALTDEQSEQIRPILAEQAEQIQAIREKYGFTGRRGQGGGRSQRPDRSQMQAMRADLETLGEQTDAKLATVLSEEQMETWKAIQAERQQQRGQRGGRRGGRG